MEPCQATIYDGLFPQRRGDKWYTAPWGIATPDFNSVSEYKRANSLVLNELFPLDIVCNAIRGVIITKTRPPEAQARQLVIALFASRASSSRQLRLQLQKTNALEERIGALEEGKTKLNKRRREMTYRRLRDWADPSYSPDNGRAAKSSMPVQKNYGADGEKWSVNAQMAKGQPGKGYAELVKKSMHEPLSERTTVSKRPIG